MTLDSDIYQARPDRPKRLPQALLASLAGLLMAAALTAVIAVALSQGPPPFAGTELVPAREIMDFQLTDQFGEPVRLTDLSPQVVVLTFLYTHCPDVCPLTTARLLHTYLLLGADAQRVTFLAVTVDPDRDSQQQVYDYSRQGDMLEKWHYLTGDEEVLQPLWDYYWAGSVRAEVTKGTEEHGEEASSPNSASKTGYLVAHSAPIHVIADGVVRVAFGESFQPSELAHDLQLLLR